MRYCMCSPYCWPYVWFEHPGHTYGGFVPSFSERGVTDDCNGKMSLITESVTGKEPDQHVIRLTPRGSHVWQPLAKSLLHRNPSPVHWWSLGPRPHTPSHNILKAGSAVQRSSYRATCLTGPIKTQHVVSRQVQTCHRGENCVVLNRHEQRLPHRNLGIAIALSPPFPSECSTDPPPCPSRSSNSN
jgi:hypothetical protein